MKIDSSRIQNPAEIEFDDVKAALAKWNTLTIQFSDSTSYKENILAAVDKLCEAFDERLCIRFYGHYTSSFDMRTILRVPNVKNLSVDCIMQVENLHALSELNHLRALRLGIFELENRTILSSENLHQLQQLSLGPSRSDVIDLAPLRNMTDMRSLSLHGHTKNIDTLRSLQRVEYLQLNVAKKVGLGFVNSMNGLKHLKLILGGRDNINEVDGQTIESVEIIRVRGFCRFDHLPSWRKLKRLRIEDQIRLESLPFAVTSESLEDIRLINCKTLSKLQNLADLPQLRHLQILGTAIDLDNLSGDGLPESLKQFSLYTGRLKVDGANEQKLAQMGYEKAQFTPYIP